MSFINDFSIGFSVVLSKEFVCAFLDRICKSLLAWDLTTSFLKEVHPSSLNTFFCRFCQIGDNNYKTCGFSLYHSTASQNLVSSFHRKCMFSAHVSYFLNLLVWIFFQQAYHQHLPFFYKREQIRLLFVSHL